MGIVLGVISGILILSAIYFRIDNKKRLSIILFWIGILGSLFFVITLVMAIFE